MRVVVTLTDTSGVPRQRILMAGQGVVQLVRWESPYLVSAGQAVEFGLSAHVTMDPEPKMPDASAWTQIALLPQPVEYRAYDLPTTRSLSAIMRDVVAHGLRFPTHGVGCACMDRYIGEVRAQATSSVPAWVAEMDTDREMWEDRMDALMRVRHVLHIVAGGL